MNKKVLVTGVSGWIAKHTAIELLNSGYEVLGTVRNKNLIEQTKETLSKYATIDNLSFIELDLLKDEGWNEAAKGCKYIMHIASPFPMKVSNDRESLLPPAVGVSVIVVIVIITSINRYGLFRDCHEGQIDLIYFSFSQWFLRRYSF